MEMNTLVLIFCFIAAVLSGFWIGYGFGRGKKTYDGVFRVNTHDPDKDIFSLELNCPLGSIPDKKEIIFQVVNECSQEKQSL